MPASPGSTKSSANARAAKTASVLNWRVRYACAPSSTACPMRFMFSVPSGAASTSCRNTSAKASATTAMTATMTTKVVLPPERDTSTPLSARVTGTSVTSIEPQGLSCIPCTREWCTSMYG